MPRAPHCRLGCALFLASVALSSAALGDAPSPPLEAADGPSEEAISEARERYARGRQLFQEGAYDAALAELERAFELAPTPALLYNLGLVHVARKDHASALTAYERYLVDESAPSVERRAEVEHEIARLKPRVAELVIVADAGAELSVDDVSVGTAPLAAPIRVNVGRRHVRALRSGRSRSQVVTLAGGEKKELTLELAPVPEQRRTPRPVSLPSPKLDSERTDEQPGSQLWLGWVATGVLAAGAIASGVFAYSASNELDEQAKTSDTSRAELDDTHDRMRAFAVAADILGAAALVTGGVTLYLSLSSRTERTPASVHRGGVGVELAPSSVRLRGSF